MELAVHFSQWELDQGRLYVKGTLLEGKISSHALPYPYPYLDLALTKAEVDTLVRKLYQKSPQNSVEVPYLSGLSLKDYLEQAYGADLELFVESGEVRLQVRNLSTPMSEKILGFQHSKRRPGYLMRGKSVTQEQAMELFLRSEWETQTYLSPEFRLHAMNFYTCFTGGERKFFSSIRSWIGLDGLIGNDGITQKYPTMLEFLEELTELAGLFPYLDLIIVVANNDEWGYSFAADHDFGENVVDLNVYLEDRLHEKFENQNPLYSKEDYEREKWQDWGFVLKDGKVEVLNYQEISAKFQEYYEKYDANLQKGEPVTCYSWTDPEEDCFTIYDQSCRPQYFRPLGEKATEEDIKAWLEQKNQEYRAKYL